MKQKLTIEVTPEQHRRLYEANPELITAPAKHKYDWTCPSDGMLGTRPSEPEGCYLQFRNTECWNKTDLRHLRDYLDRILGGE